MTKKLGKKAIDGRKEVKGDLTILAGIFIVAVLGFAFIWFAILNGIIQ